MKERKKYNFTSDTSYKNGTILEDKDFNRFKVLSSIDLEWLIGDYNKEGYENRFYVNMCFIGNFKNLKEENKTTNKSKTNIEENQPLTQ